MAAGRRWLTPIILATWEAEIRRIEAGNYLEKNPSQKRTGGVAQV
jgi:hypothetical protein